MRIFIVVLLLSLFANNGYCQGTFRDCSDIMPMPGGYNSEPKLVSDNHGELYIYFGNDSVKDLRGLYKFNDNRTALINLKIEDSISDFMGIYSEDIHIRDITVDKNGILHIAALVFYPDTPDYNYSFFLLKYDGIKFYDFAKTEFELDKIAVDTQNNDWFLSIDGIVKYDGKSFVFYESSLTRGNCYDIDIDKNGNPIVGIDGKGLLVFDGADWKTNYVEEDSLNSLFPDELKSVNVDRNGNVWLLGSSAAAIYDGEKWTVERQYLLDDDIMIYTSFYCMVQDEKGYYWFGHQIGLSGYDSLNWSYKSEFNSPFETIALDKNDVIWLGTINRLYCYALNISDILQEKNKPYQLEISNYPNPFNPTTTISYSIPAPGHVSLSVYNIAGQKVAALVSGNMNAGNYGITFDGSNLPSGLYFYCIDAGKFNKTGRMLLVK
jgi:hypothetical protein